MAITWEYATVIVDRTATQEQIESEIDVWGADGWELVGFHPNHEGHWLFVFKQSETE